MRLQIFSFVAGKNLFAIMVIAWVLFFCCIVAGCGSNIVAPVSAGCDGNATGCQSNSAPTINLIAQPATINSGQSSTLKWTSHGSAELDLEPGIGAVPASGSVSVSPQQTTTYTLTVAGNRSKTEKASTTVTVSSSQHSGVQLSPRDDLQAAVNSNAAGTTFVLSPGIYLLQSVVPKNGDIFSGEKGAVLDGAELLTDWRAYSSAAWEASVTNITKQASYNGTCQPAYPVCMYPEDLFFDSQPLRRVASLSLVTAGTWYLDYSTDTAYVGSDPSGHVVEMSALPAAFSGAATNVKIQGLTIEKYASIASDGAVEGAQSSHWVISNDEFCLNHGMGLRVGPYMQVENNKFHDNGQMGLGGSGDYIVVDSNEIYKNNYAGYDWGWEAGGDKFTFTKYLTVSNNYSHDNNGPGLWTDIDNYYTTYEGNHTARNVVAGIIHEISYDAVIKNNLIEDDGFVPNQNTLWYGAGIVISNSVNVQVYGNTITDCMNGISGIQNNRGDDPATGQPYTLKNLDVHDNTITQQVDWAEGIVKPSGYDDSVYTSWGNHFQNDTYTLSDPNHPYFCWLDQDWTLAQWQEYTAEH